MGRAVTSWRWWFENRETGAITVLQFPNWPLWAIAVGWVVRLLADTGSTLHRAAGIGVAALWLYWGGLELLRGVNPWRRLLGALVIGWQVFRILS